MLASVTHLRDYPTPLRQLTVRGLGHERPNLLLTNQTGRADPPIDHYAHRMLIENATAEDIDSFHTDALSATVPFRTNLDLLLTMIGNLLYHRFDHRLGQPFDVTRALQIFNAVVKSSAAVTIGPRQIHVRLGCRAHNHLLRVPGLRRDAPAIPWFGDRLLWFG